MTSFLLALQFLTSIPIKISKISGKRIGLSLIYFPIIGSILGFALITVNSLLIAFGIPNLTINIILVIILVLLTAGLHLDGLSDTSDAFLSGKDKSDMLLIMRDPHIGVMGVLSILGILLLKIGLLSSLLGFEKQTALLLMCILSRWSSVLMIFLFPYARESGKAKAFIEEINLNIFTISTFIALILAFIILGIHGLILLLIIGGFAYLIGKMSIRKISGITGDVIGATIEITEVITLAAICFIK